MGSLKGSWRGKKGGNVSEREKERRDDAYTEQKGDYRAFTRSEAFYEWNLLFFLREIILRERSINAFIPPYQWEMICHKSLMIPPLQPRPRLTFICPSSSVFSRSPRLRIRHFPTVWLTLKQTNKVFDSRHNRASVMRGIMSCPSQSGFDINSLYLGNGGQGLLQACCWLWCCQFQWQISYDERVGKAIVVYCKASTHLLLTCCWRYVWLNLIQCV